MNNIMAQLVKKKTENETEWLEMGRKILEYYFSTSPQSVREVLYKEFDRLDKEVAERSEHQKKYM